MFTTAARLRFITYATGISRRFVDFAVEAFDSCRNVAAPDTVLSSLWAKHFAGTGFDERKSEFHEVAAEILLSRTVDAFLYYLADIIGWALRHRPAVADLHEEAQHRASEFNISLDDAVQEVAELHAERVSYGGFGAMLNFIETTFAVSLPIDPGMKAKLRRLIATRNMVVHNRSRKNARYCKDVEEPLANIGQLVRPSLTEAQSAAEDLANFVELVDETLRREIFDFASEQEP